MFTIGDKVFTMNFLRKNPWEITYLRKVFGNTYAHLAQTNERGNLETCLVPVSTLFRPK